MTTLNALDHIISSVRSSELNYSYQETPFSLYLTIRKTKIKKHEASGFKSSQTDVKALKEENLSLKGCISDLQDKLDASKHTMTILEGKVDASEAEALKAFEHIKEEKETLAKKDAELEGLKNVIKDKNSIIAKFETEKMEFHKIIEKGANV